MNSIKAGDDLLIIWKNSSEPELGNLVSQMKVINQNGHIDLENCDILNESSRNHSSYDVVISNWLPPHSVTHNNSLLSIIIRLLKPNGKLILKDNFDVIVKLKLNGFLNVANHSENVYTAVKPNFEVGSKVSLKLSSKPQVWKINNDVEDAWISNNGDETIDSDDLLDEDDKKKPDTQNLRVCATTGKRKACADCSCGLAEELKGETKQTPKSSCGSCYLGDAFRCATCPYLGMPAFKPGEKVILDLNNDL